MKKILNITILIVGDFLVLLGITVLVKGEWHPLRTFMDLFWSAFPNIAVWFLLGWLLELFNGPLTKSKEPIWRLITLPCVISMISGFVVEEIVYQEIIPFSEIMTTLCFQWLLLFLWRIVYSWLKKVDM